MTGSFEMLRNNPAHIGSGAIQGVSKIGNGMSPVQRITPITSSAEKTGQVENPSKSFDSYLLEAMDFVNNKQNVSSNIAQQLITDPDSVDVHDVTIAMAEANLSLSIAQGVIDRLVRGWNEITTTR
ncbi:MAG: flagellar hook-basal body complex protein FliE [Treponemataceae bacterium]|nr:flagellar hook-basal body complex protein FliE [Treponemataceae bacterium]